ncbi:Multisite-specific tRNA:(cytosine-C(5))-methyltransferase [Lachnellula hyalina]|uniref:Multisite-specific tRNA:(Cytosine-C(5))-methyltransferase n=1 Tax=Lachnellula hyalina TaxID=1316788 RepID=A0A8H8QZZ6_9HELO|nr:Multisite-specific tRNA:(cytosine-C(5))-methyltransferase [Lachnellula hyalina]TVY25265.1 Multisite-specific tRNA:(cytosine-C(5))-methyltransferase [Lachnellula hyalina]
MARGGKRGGGFRGKRGGGGGRGGGRGGDRAPYDNRVSYDKVPKHNARLEKYYNDVLGLPEEEREAFWDAYKRELPNSFRFTGSKGHALAVQKLFQDRYIPEISSISHHDGNLVEPPKPVPWYPDDLAWWMTTPKNVVRRFPPFAAFQKFLVSETSVGNISRQEVVSMIPPLVMDLQPGMTVLDMCAAPGSKAAQLLEMVHRGEEARVHKSLRDHAQEDGREISPGPELTLDDAEKLEVDSSDYGRATGLLIANDSDYKRSHMLIHQLKRLSSPNLIVTNHDATMYPSIKLPPTPENPATNRYLKFDRILADVPCSGDGTMRKNVNLWKDWQPGNALGLHITQVRILVRALQMLKVGGRVVYSTCSMNPVENEAVIASAIERCGGLKMVQLVPSDDQLPLLKRTPGLKKWSIMDKVGDTWSTMEEVEEYDKKYGSTMATEKLSPGMFAPKVESGEEEIPFERCMRVYGHMQDTGGFFIAILEKKAEFRAKPESEPKKTSDVKPTITAIVDEIESMPAPVDGGSVAPKIEAADALTGPSESTTELTPVARQNQENPAPDATVSGTKRSAEDDEEEVAQSQNVSKPVEHFLLTNLQFDAVSRAKKLKTKEDLEEPASAGFQDRQVHYPPPPGAELDLTTRPGDLRDDKTPFRANPNKNRNNQQFEEPFKYISGTHDEVQSIESFYKLSPRFPRDRFMVRNAQGEPAKTIYYTSALIRDIMTENEGKGIKFIHGGVRMFMKQDVQGEGVCKWRIQSEGMPILEGYVGSERVVRLYKKETLRKLLIEMFPKLSDGAWKDLGEIGERVNNIGMGCCVLRIEPSEEADGFTERQVIPLWRSLHSLNLMLAKEDRTAMLLRIFNDTTPLVNNHNPGKKADPAPPPEVEVEADDAMDGVIKGVGGIVGSIEGAAPVNTDAVEANIKPGPYDTIASAPKTGAELDVKAERIAKGDDTEGGDIEGQVGALP